MRSSISRTGRIVTYGGHVGTKCSEQLKQVASAVKLRLAATTPALVLSDAVIRDGVALDPNQDFSLHVTSVRSAFAELTDLMLLPRISNPDAKK